MLASRRRRYLAEPRTERDVRELEPPPEPIPGGAGEERAGGLSPRGPAGEATKNPGHEGPQGLRHHHEAAEERREEHRERAPAADPPEPIGAIETGGRAPPASSPRRRSPAATRGR